MKWYLIIILILIVALIVLISSIIDQREKDNITKIIKTNKYNDNLDFMLIAKSIIESEKYLKMKKFIQHGHTSTYDHSINVAYISFLYAKKRNKYDINSMVRGALLHDYYLYDWHDKQNRPHLHGFVHPSISFQNASSDYQLTKKEKDIILKHMFPLTFWRIPHYKETILVSKVDKQISWLETKNKI